MCRTALKSRLLRNALQDITVNKTLKPNGISHSVVPDKPMTYNGWMQYIHAQNQSK